MTKYFHFVLAKHRNDIEHKGKTGGESSPPPPVFSRILGTSWMPRVGSGGWRGAVLLVLPYIRLLRGRWVAGRGARSKPLGNSSEKGTNPGPQLQARPSSDRGDPARSRSSPGQEPPRSNLHRWRGGARRRAGCAWPQPPGQGNSPNGAKKNLFILMDKEQYIILVLTCISLDHYYLCLSFYDYPSSSRFFLVFHFLLSFWTRIVQFKVFSHLPLKCRQ